jgi:serine/threonine protein kinase
VVACERLGVGTRCETWLGWSQLLWCPVVVKMARPHQRIHPRARLSLTREVSALQNNPHPVLPRLLGTRLDAGIPHVILEFLDGAPLDEVIDDAPLDRISTAMLGTQLLSALTAVHRRGIAHLDIKPENVILHDCRPTLVDFGSARLIGSAQPAGSPVGTAGYAAAEMEACQPISSSMDVYGVGVTLREAVTGFSVYDVDPERRAIAAEPPYPADSADLAGLLARMIAPEPADRPTVPEALDAFGDLLGDRLRPWPTGITARTAGAGDRAHPVLVR